MTGKPASWRDTLPVHPACDFKMSPDRLAAGFQQRLKNRRRALGFYKSWQSLTGLLPGRPSTN